MRKCCLYSDCYPKEEKGQTKDGVCGFGGVLSNGSGRFPCECAVDDDILVCYPFLGESVNSTVHWESAENGNQCDRDPQTL